MLDEGKENLLLGVVHQIVIQLITASGETEVMVEVDEDLACGGEGNVREAHLIETSLTSKPGAMILRICLVPS